MNTLDVDSSEIPTADAEGSEAVRFCPGRARSEQPAGAVVGVLIGFEMDGRVPLVSFPGQTGSAAVAASSTVDLHGIHIGRQVVLVFTNSDASHPIIVGLLRTAEARPVAELAGRVEIEADGRRMIIEAKEQLVLRCGSASITLTKAGKVLIHGDYVSHSSSGVLRIKGSSVQVN